jgi:putative ubiquitin-RnfH superfamily antitoxin RatB of RatAB toxin-antitoxin module
MSIDKRSEVYQENKSSTTIVQQEPKIEPFIGPRPFKRDVEDQMLFFGRDKESNEILSLVFSHKLILLYAQSGAGKTSIINAQVIPALEKFGYIVLPIARVGVASDRSKRDDNLTLHDRVNFYLLNALQSLIPTSDPKSFSDKSLSVFLNTHFPKNKKIEGKAKPQVQVLVFDQLEEIFRFYPGNTWREQQGDFFRQVAEALENDPQLRIVFVIREDYLAELDRFVDILPERLRPRLRLERLQKEAAFKAIKGPLEKTSENLFQLFSKEEITQQIEELINDLLKIRVEDPLTGDPQEIRGEFVEPIQLQVVCRRWWHEKLSAKKIDSQTQIQIERSLTDVDRALTDFYEDALRGAVTAASKTGISEDIIRGMV